MSKTTPCNGFYLMHRGWMDNPALDDGKEPYCKRAAWAYLIEHARWSDGQCMVMGQEMTIRRGQVAETLRTLAREWAWDTSKVRRFLSALVKQKMLTMESDTGMNILTICNYDSYQTPSCNDDTTLTQDRHNSDAGLTQVWRENDTYNKEKKEGNKEERVHLATLDVPAEPAPRQPVVLQTSLLPDPDPEPAPPKPLTDGQILYREGIDILVELTGNKKASAITLMGDLQKQIGGKENAASLMEILRRARADPPASPVGWIRAAIANRKLRLVASNDPNDAWGVKAWCRAHPEIREATAADKEITGLQISPTDRIMAERGFGDWLSGGFFIDKAAELVARAALLPWDWRGDWSPLLDWVKAGHPPADIVRKIERKLESWSEYRPGSLKAFSDEFSMPGPFAKKSNGRAA